MMKIAKPKSKIFVLSFLNIFLEILPKSAITYLNNFFDNFLPSCHSRLQELLDIFNDEGESNYLVAFMRLLTSMQIKKEAELYINFLENDTDVHNFCATEVEPMFRESDIVHIHALSKVKLPFFIS